MLEEVKTYKEHALGCFVSLKNVKWKIRTFLVFNPCLIHHWAIMADPISP